MQRLAAYIFSLLATACAFAAQSDSIPSGFSRPLHWRVGVEAAGAYVPATNSFLKGFNMTDKRIRGNFSSSLRADFSFDGATRQGQLYKGIYQGVGLGVNTFFAHELLGTPVSAYVYQGAPFARLSAKTWLGYEWRFGAAFGWKHYKEDTDTYNGAVSTSVTAMMGLGIKLHHALSPRLTLSVGIDAVHFSNGNTSWPNAGVNTVGATLGLAYALNPPSQDSSDDALQDDGDTRRWTYDIMAYGAWRKRVVTVGHYVPEAELCPGKFGVLGIQFSPMRTLNRWVAVGPSLDLQWDESAGLAPYWIDGYFGSDMKFERPPFGKQIKAGISARAELTTPIFHINAGLGYDFINPRGDKRFYQLLALKTFVTEKIYLNVGYRLGSFKDPQNLMLGVGFRL